MLNIPDPWVWLAYVLCLGSTVLCVVYGLINWNRGDEPVQREDVTWATQEKKVEETL